MVSVRLTSSGPRNGLDLQWGEPQLAQRGSMHDFAQMLRQEGSHQATAMRGEMGVNGSIQRLVLRRLDVGRKRLARSRCNRRRSLSRCDARIGPQSIGVSAACGTLTQVASDGPISSGVGKATMTSGMRAARYVRPISRNSRVAGASHACGSVPRLVPRLTELTEKTTAP